ncbi:MAG: HIT domain-containing protein [Candidatus Omnitrophica bacterium]|nr:HIT domain-containing protein [Candidatus Omnitrophota bacterium]
MDRLWAPWRIKYVTAKKNKKGCVFCASLKNKHSKAIIFRSSYSFVILNAFPYNNGHLMVVPKRHIADIYNLKDNEIIDFFRSLSKARQLLDKVLRPDGYNGGFNLFPQAGAGITGHFHFHLVPRWLGDTNFMPVIFDTKIISQSLDELSKKLKDAYTE